ncbi:valacyclovir hydrolase isoform X2 [Phycodurus eques]|uniref:valacyclovir hydrolase isoform X2 n=1 Tax=Phycodurus eques TaxID=693459 RepID=UPI002ACE06C6|nr:valacyclovir hydrolase isoform X2 [Phycodurus eques]
MATCLISAGRLRNLRRTTTARHSYCSSLTCGRQNVNGVDLYYEKTGTGKHAVVLLPGALVVGWDPRGYGLSRPPDRDFPLDFFENDARDAVDLMRTLGFVKFSLLGWSDGGIAALIAAAKNPALINKMVIWGSNAFVSQQDLDIYKAVCDVSTWSTRMRAPMEEVYGAEVFAKTWEAWVNGIEQFAHRPQGNICIDLLPLIRCPTLIIHGEKDPIVPSCHPYFLLKHIRGSRLHLMPDGKHNLHLRFPEEFNNLVEDFLQERQND